MKTRSIVTACALTLLVLASACGAGQPQTSAPAASQPASAAPFTSPLAPTVLPPVPAKPLALIFGDDGSPDGTTALLYLLSHPLADLKAVDIVFGEAHPEIYIQHIGRMLDSFGIASLPLGYGQDSPLVKINEFPEGMRQSANNFWGWPIPNANKTYPAQPAPELIVSVVRQSTSPVTIFVSGPLTNLAQALRLDPGLVKNVSGIFIMGGAVYVPGNIQDLSPDTQNKTAEWNIYADPQAASEVFESGLAIYLVPLDATDQVLVTSQDIAQWRQGGKLANFAADIYDGLLRNWHAKDAAIWDVMTAVLMLDPELCGFRALHLDVDAQASETSGQTAVVPGQQPNVSVCLEPDAVKIRQKLVDVFSSSAAREAAFSAPKVTPSSPPVPTPENLIFRDDFTGAFQPGWKWEHERPSRWSITPARGVTPEGWLLITGEDSSLLAEGWQSNLLCRAAPEGDFQITLHLSANPTSNFQQATLYLFQDGENYIAMNRGFCGPCGGSGLFVEYKYTGGWGSFKVLTDDTDVFLRFEAKGKTITGLYALEAEEWQRFGRVGYYLKHPRVCLGVSNVDSAGAENSDLVGSFDYLDVIRP